jgi:divalent metal cation (Fe/Co/Zn/Cd) transporter
VIFWNGVKVLKPALSDLMDRAPGDSVVSPVSAAAMAVPGVLAIEKLRCRRAGTFVYVDIHVQADATMSLDAAHHLSGAVKAAIRESVPTVIGVLIHMEPYEGPVARVH